MTDGPIQEDRVLAGGNRRPVQARRVRCGWTVERRGVFLDHLAATCNVTAAAAAVGLSQTGAYNLRRRDADFAGQWRLALLAGYDQLEAELLRKAIGMLQEVPVADPDRVAMGPMTVEQAIRLLERHRALDRTDRPRLRETGRDSRATQAETDAVLVARLKMLRRQREDRA